MSSLTPKEVADLLQITTNTVYEMVKRGELNAYRVGRKMRIDPRDVEEYKIRTSTGGFQTYEKTSPDLAESIDLDNKMIVCGNDVLLDILVKHLELNKIGIPVFRSYLGSYNGLYALYQERVSVATSHLWDGDSGEYNKAYVKRMVPGVPVIGIHLAYRKQGFYVKKGNPLEIKGWSDLKRKDIRIVNREKGSGVRILLDEQLRLQNIIASNMKGYHRESTSDIGTASMVSRGEADLAVGKESISTQVGGIDFISLQEESIEIIIKKENIHERPFKILMDVLKSKEFSNEIGLMEGYDTKDTGKILFET